VPVLHVRRILLALVVLAICAGGMVACITQPWVSPATMPDASVDPGALEHHVRALTQTYHPRSVDDATQLDAAGDFVLAQLRSAGANPDIRSYEVDGRTYRNFVARFGPAEGQLLVIGAHYDACGSTPGADDNASGTAALIELTRLLAGKAPARPVELVAYTLEEPPYFRTGAMGSAHHAEGLHRQGREVRLMIAVEMIGFYRDTPRSQAFPMAGLDLLYPDTGNFIAVVGKFSDFGTMRRVKGLFLGASNLPVETINAPASVPGVDFSDHRNYWKFGIPAVMVTDTAFLRNPNYHGSGDTADTLDYPRMAKVVRALYAVAMEF
jgi:Zn-dependent M28 family amino/carboxypeptidase